MANQSAERHGKESGHTRAKLPWWEHGAAVLGALITIAALGFMIYEAVSAPADAVPHLSVRIDTVAAYGTAYAVRFRAINDGDATAANVQVHGELHADAGMVEHSQSTIDFVPARSWREGGLVFQNDPRRYRLEVRPVGFDRP